MKAKALLVRVGSGLALALVAFALIWAGSFATMLLAAVVAVFMAREWTNLTLPVPDRDWRGASLFLAVPLVLVLIGAWAEMRHAGHLTFALTFLAAAAALVPLAWRAKREGTPGFWWLAGVIYLGVPGLCLLALRFAEGGLSLVVWVVVVVIATDTVAYFVGKTLKGPKLAPRISPGKTWSGFWGGLGGAVVAGAAFSALSGLGFLAAGLVGAAVSLASQVGDLFESSMKRRAGVKDSGNVIPGHGGVLDRVDGYLFAVPVFTLIVALVRP